MAPDKLRHVPLVVQRCISEVGERGVAIEGIYRLSSNMSKIQALVHEIERDEAEFATSEIDHDPVAMAGVLKLYLRSLPHPLFYFPLAEYVDAHQSKACTR